MQSMWRAHHDRNSYAVPPGHPSRQHQPTSDAGFTNGMRMLGREFNPMKFDFAPMRQFNPLKFEFDLEETTEPQDLLDMLPESLGPERPMSSPQTGATSHQDVSLSHRLHSNAHNVDQPGQALDDATMSLLDSLELKLTPSFSMDDVQPQGGMMAGMVDNIFKPRNSHLPAVPSGAMDHISCAVVEGKTHSFPEKHEQMTAEELRVMRNKAVQKRYRIRKKTQASRQQNIFGARKAELAMAERKAPTHHVAVVDKLMRLRTLNGDRDAEIERLRKVLAEEQTSSEVPAGKIMVIKGAEVEEGDYCDNNIEVVLPRDVAMAGVVEACCEKMAGSLDLGNEAINDAVIRRFKSTASPRLSTL